MSLLVFAAYKFSKNQIRQIFQRGNKLEIERLGIFGGIRRAELDVTDLQVKNSTLWFDISSKTKPKQVYKMDKLGFPRLECASVPV